jgi:hypothetical protein
MKSIIETLIFVNWSLMINMYLRGPKFKNCIQAFVDFGLKFDNKVLLYVLLDDAISLDKLLTDN